MSRTWSWKRKVLSRNARKNDLDLNKLEINRKKQGEDEAGFFSFFLASFSCLSFFTKNINVDLELCPAQKKSREKIFRDANFSFIENFELKSSPFVLFLYFKSYHS